MTTYQHPIAQAMDSTAAGRTELIKAVDRLRAGAAGTLLTHEGRVYQAKFIPVAPFLDIR